MKIAHIADTHIKNLNGTINRNRFIDIGDVAYGFIHDEKLYKFGKASGTAGWYDRATQYRKYGKSLDKTSRKIINYMVENNISKFIVYGLKCSKQKINFECPITKKIVNILTETATAMEQYLIQEAYKVGEKLPLCQEVKK